MRANYFTHSTLLFTHSTLLFILYLLDLLDDFLILTLNIEVDTKAGDGTAHGTTRDGDVPTHGLLRLLDGVDAEIKKPNQDGG